MTSKTLFATVPRLFPGETIVCLGTGPSLTGADVGYCRERARVIAVNDAYTVAPWADAMYAADAKWWRWHQGAPDFAGLKYAIEPQPNAWPRLQVLRNTGRDGLELKPTGLRTGLNSGYQSIGLAVHLGASRIVLLGFDLQGDHFFGAHRDHSKPPFAGCLKSFATIAEPLRAAGVEIVNCTPGSALRSFPMARLHDVLASKVEAAS